MHFGVCILKGGFGSKFPLDGSTCVANVCLKLLFRVLNFFGNLCLNQAQNLGVVVQGREDTSFRFQQNLWYLKFCQVVQINQRVRSFENSTLVTRCSLSLFVCHCCAQFWKYNFAVFSFWGNYRTPTMVLKGVKKLFFGLNWKKKSIRRVQKVFSVSFLVEIMQRLRKLIMEFK